MTEYETTELAALADDLAQIPHPMAEEVLINLMAFITENGK